MIKPHHIILQALIAFLFNCKQIAVIPLSLSIGHEVSPEMARQLTESLNRIYW